jgi:hypothetical protein
MAVLSTILVLLIVFVNFVDSIKSFRPVRVQSSARGAKPLLLAPLSLPARSLFLVSAQKDHLPLISESVKSGIASALATAVVKFTLQPFDTIKTVQQMNDRKYMGVMSTAKLIVKERGLFGLWSGVDVTVLGSLPSIALYFGIYNSIKTRVSTVLPPSLHPLAVVVAAIVGNTFACALRVPYEVIYLFTNGVHPLNKYCSGFLK